MKKLEIIIIFLLFFYPIVLYLINRQVTLFDLILTCTLLVEALFILNRNIKKKWFWISEDTLNVFFLTRQANLFYIFLTIIGLGIVFYCSFNPDSTNGFIGILYRLGLLFMVSSPIIIKATRKTEKYGPLAFRLKNPFRKKTGDKFIERIKN